MNFKGRYSSMKVIDYETIVKTRKPRKPDRVKTLDPFEERKARLRFEKILWPEGKPICPFCGHLRSYIMHKREGYYKCASCRSQYTIRVGTVMHGTHLSYIDWWKVIEQFCISEKGYPGLQVEKYIDCTYKTAWYLGHRLRCAMLNDRFAKKLKGIVEVDEIYLGNRKKTPKFADEEKIRRVKRPFVFDLSLKKMAIHYFENPDLLIEIVCGTFLIGEYFKFQKEEKETKKKQKKGRKRGRGTSKKAVLVLVERGGQSIAIPMSRLNKTNLTAELLLHVCKEAKIVSDGFKGYCELENVFAEHKTVNHSQGIFDKNAEHINFAESFNSLLRRGYFGVFHQYTDRHLHRYCVEMSYKRNQVKMDRESRIKKAISRFGGKRMFYKRKDSGILLSVYAFKQVLYKVNKAA